MGNNALRLDDGKVFNLPKKSTSGKQDISQEEQEKWRIETSVNFAITFLEETDQWEMKLRNVKFAVLPDEDWERLSANKLQGRFSTLKWNEPTNAEADQKEKGFYSLIFTRGMNPPMTFAFETADGQRGIFQFYATNRTATFVFYIGERYFGVITAYVQGREAENYHFTSALPVTLLKLLAPTLLAKLDKNFKEPTTIDAEGRVVPE